MADHDDFVAACRSYWDVRTTQATSGLGEGSGAAVRGGRHFDAIQALVAKVFLDAGFTGEQILLGASATLPGYYRATKNWDLVVVERDALVAAFELKSLGGPSFGNNFNNRSEEAVGNADDLWEAFNHGRLGALRPWLGYFFLIEDAEGSRRPVRASVRVGTVDPAFNGKTYCERAAQLCTRLKKDEFYSAVCFATSSRDPAEVPHEPVDDLNWATFTASIRARIAHVRSI